MKPSDHYRALTERLLDDLAWGTLSEDEDEAIREQMDDLWTQMTAKERQEADDWLAAQRSKAPQKLDLEDVRVDKSVRAHRRHPSAAE